MLIYSWLSSACEYTVALQICTSLSLLLKLSSSFCPCPFDVSKQFLYDSLSFSLFWWHFFMSVFVSSFTRVSPCVSSKGISLCVCVEIVCDLTVAFSPLVTLNLSIYLSLLEYFWKAVYSCGIRNASFLFSILLSNLKISLSLSPSPPTHSLNLSISQTNFRKQISKPHSSPLTQQQHSQLNTSTHTVSSTFFFHFKLKNKILEHLTLKTQNKRNNGIDKCYSIVRSYLRKCIRIENTVRMEIFQSDKILLLLTFDSLPSRAERCGLWEGTMSLQRLEI